MTSRRISLQLRTRAAADISQQQQQQQQQTPHHSHSPSQSPQSREAKERFASNSASASAASLKARSSRLRPTVPLHMTTRRQKTALDTTSTPTNTTTATTTTTTTTSTNTATSSSSSSSQPTPTSSAEPVARQQCSPTLRKNISSSPQPTTKPVMPPKRVHSSQALEEEHPKKRLRGPISSSPSAMHPPELSKGTDAPVVSDIKPPQPISATPVIIKRPRGRPPSKLKAAAALAEKNNIAQCTALKEPQPPPPPTPTAAAVAAAPQTSIPVEIKSTAPSTAPSDVPRRKVPKKDLMDQFHKKQQLAFKHASTEQLRRRQTRLQNHYFALAQLAKKNNALLVDKSIEILSTVSDIDLARTQWVGDILAGLEKREEARVEQIHFEQRIRMIEARHTYTATKERILTEYDNRCLDARKKFLESASEEISFLDRRYSPLDNPLPSSPSQTFIDSPSVEAFSNKDMESNSAPQGLDVLAYLAGLEQHLPPPSQQQQQKQQQERSEAGIRLSSPTTSSIRSDTSSVAAHSVRGSPS